MSISQDVFHLVASMRPGEKRYLRNNNANKKETQYIKLFNLIEKAVPYVLEGDTKAEKYYQQIRRFKNLSRIKNYLLKEILTVMSDLNQDLKDELHLDFLRAKEIFDRGAFEIAFKLFEAAKERSLQAEDYTLTHEILSYQLKCLISPDLSAKGLKEKIRREQQLCLEALSEIGAINAVSDQFVEYTTENFIIRRIEDVDYISDIYNEPIFEKEAFASAKAEMKVLYLKSGIFDYLNDPQESLKLALKLDSLLQNTAYYQADYLSAFTLYYNIVGLAIRAGEYDIARTCLLKSKEILEKHSAPEMYKLYIYSSKIAWAYQFGLFSFVSKDITVFKRLFNSICENLHEKQVTFFSYLLGVYAYGIGNLEESKLYFEKIASREAVSGYTDLKRLSRLILAMISFELGDPATLDSCLKRYAKFRNSENWKPQPEENIFLFLHKAAKATPDYVEKALIKLKLDLVPEHFRNIDFQVFDLFNFQAWVRHMTEPVTYAEAVRDFAEKRKGLTENQLRNLLNIKLPI